MSPTPENPGFSFGSAIMVSPRFQTDHDRILHQTRPFTEKRADRPRSMSSLAAETTTYQGSSRGPTSAVLPSNDQLLDSLPTATRLQGVLEGKVPGLPRFDATPGGSQSKPARVPSESLPLTAEAEMLVGHFLDHTNTSLPILSETRLWAKVGSLYNDVGHGVAAEDVCLVFRERGSVL